MTSIVRPPPVEYCTGGGVGGDAERAALVDPHAQLELDFDALECFARDEAMVVHTPLRSFWT